MVFLRRSYQIQFNSSGGSDPDLEIRGGSGFVLYALPAFIRSVISSFFTKNKAEVRTFKGLSPGSATDFTQKKETEKTKSQHLHQNPPVTIKAQNYTSDNVQIKCESLQDSTFLQPIPRPPKLINEYHLTLISSSHD